MTDLPISATNPPSNDGPGLSNGLEAPPWPWDGTYDQLRAGIVTYLENGGPGKDRMVLTYEDRFQDSDGDQNATRDVLIPTSINVIDGNRRAFLAPCIPCHSHIGIEAGFTSAQHTVEISETGDGEAIVACTRAGCAPAAILASFGANFDIFAAELIRWDDFQTIETPPPLVAGYIDEESLVVTPGKYKGLKSFTTSVNLASSLATGVDWFGIPIIKPVPVIVLATENGKTIPHRVVGWAEHHNPDMGLLKANLTIRRKPFNLRDTNKVEQLTRTANDLGARYILIDTLAKAIPGADENSSSDMSPVVEALTYIRDETGAAVHTVTHTGLRADGRSRGWSGYDDAHDIILPIFGKWSPGHPVTLRSIKQRSRADPDPITIGLRHTPSGLPVAVRVDKATIDTDLLAIVEAHGTDGILQPDLLKETGGQFPKKTVLAALDRLDGDEYITVEAQAQMRGKPRLIRAVSLDE